VTPRSSKKLSFKYYGPFKVLERIGEVAYILELPLNNKIHHVLHVSQLKKQIPRDTTVLEDLSSVCTEPTKAIQPERSLAKRLIQRGAHAIPQVLVKWKFLPETMETWEDEGDIEWNTTSALA
jgi:hypothetical protein